MDEKILETGEWWANSKWNEPQIFSDLQLSSIELKKVLDRIKEIFSATWFNQQIIFIIRNAQKWFIENHNIVNKNRCLLKLKNKLECCTNINENYSIAIRYANKKHPILNVLISGGSYNADILFKLGSNIVHIENTFDIKDIINRLKYYDQFDGAEFELEILHMLMKTNLKIEREPQFEQYKKNCDFKVSNIDEKLFIELKSIKKSETTNFISDICDKISWKINDNLEIMKSNVDIEVNLAKRNNKKFITKIEKANLSNNWQELSDTIINEILKNIKKTNFGSFTIKGVAEFTIQKNDSKANRSLFSFSGLPILLKHEAEKIFKSAVKKAIKQLPKNENAIILIKTEYPLYLTDVPRILAYMLENNNKYKNVIGLILIFECFTSKGIENNPKLIENQNAKFPLKDSFIIREIISKL